MSEDGIKYAYTYDNAGMFIARITADKSPLEEDVYLLPPNSTLEEPPEYPEGKIPRWNGTSWRIVTNRQAPERAAEEKLEEFLAMNPDVRELLSR